ncbi:MAG: DUF1016 N-terminal domain-containing protein [Sulfurimonas sp.]|nr:DUF1016 N-terminal domain-containing protein [Sulfurimonas sp.]
MKENWGKGVVKELADYIKLQEPTINGFTARSLWRMKQFYETYKDNEKVSPVVTEISWTNHLLLSASKSDEEREFYLRACIKERYPKSKISEIHQRIDDLDISYLRRVVYKMVVSGEVEKDGEKKNMVYFIVK